MHGVAVEEIAEFRPEKSGGRAAEDHNDFRSPGAEGLAGAKIKGDAGPAPVVDLELEGGIGLGGGVRGDAVGLAVAVVLGMISALGVGMERRTFTFSSRMDSEERFAGGSMAVMESSCIMWFCTMSRMAPTPS
ncbi:MAG: hypothetical protein EBT57_09595 [Verrucomicrobia bacterium]|nr:hypothetical protein [Verrucomicrobiota bacterium]